MRDYARKGDPHVDDHVEFTFTTDDGRPAHGYCDFCGYYSPDTANGDYSDGRLWKARLEIDGETTFIGNENAKFNWECVSTAVLCAYHPPKRERERKALEEWREEQRKTSPYYAKHRKRVEDRKAAAEFRKTLDEEYKRVLAELEWEKFAEK